jgi:hypothetical protein
MEAVELLDNVQTPAAIYLDYGSYIVFVEGVTTFLLSGYGRGASVARLSSVIGPNEKSLGVTWNTGDVPRLVFVDMMPLNGTGTTLRYNVKVISTL